MTTCKHQFIKMEDLEKSSSNIPGMVRTELVGILVCCAMCAQIREIYKKGGFRIAHYGQNDK